MKEIPPAPLWSTFTGEVFAGKPHHSSAFPWVPTRALARGQSTARGCYTLLIAGCDSHQQSSPAWVLNPEVKARDQKSCQSMLPEGLRNALLAQNTPTPMEAK